MKFIHPLISCFVFSALALAAHGAAAKRPNIIVILSDDHGWADLGCQGVRDDVKTPNIDALAADGVRCTRGYVTAPQCTPSRAGLISGRYQNRFGTDDNLHGPMPGKEVTIAERLSAAGYITGMAGKWHLSNVLNARAKGGSPYAKESEPESQGFQDVFNGLMGTYSANFNLDGTAVKEGITQIKDPRYRIDVQTDAALAFLRRHKDAAAPFFLYLSYYAPHVPLESPEPYMSRFSHVTDKVRRQGLASIAAMDDGVGKIRALLKEQGLAQDTLIWFFGDNGAPLAKAAWDGSLNEPLAGQKGNLLDGGIRVPFVISWPSVIPAGQVFTEAVSSLDVAESARVLAGISPTKELDGVDLLPFLTGKKQGAPHDYLYWRWRNQAAVLKGPHKLIVDGSGQGKLYDTTVKDGELHDLAAQNPELVKELFAKLRAWASEQKPAGLPGDKGFTFAGK